MTPDQAKVWEELADLPRPQAPHQHVGHPSQEMYGWWYVVCEMPGGNGDKGTHYLHFDGIVREGTQNEDKLWSGWYRTKEAALAAIDLYYELNY